MDKLDQIPWNQMEAGEVPALLRKLRTAPPDFSNDEAPLWLLYDALCHQGTVCEASSYAVPFLLELAASPKTPDRIGVLLVLADIAQGESGRKKWGRAVHGAVAEGFDTLVRITQKKGDVALAAAHVLAQFPEHAAKVGRILRRLLAVETRVPQGWAKNASPPTWLRRRRPNHARKRKNGRLRRFRRGRSGMACLPVMPEAAGISSLWSCTISAPCEGRGRGMGGAMG